MFDTTNILGKQGHMKSPRFQSFGESPSMTASSIRDLLRLRKASQPRSLPGSFISLRNVGAEPVFVVIWYPKGSVTVPCHN